MLDRGLAIKVSTFPCLKKCSGNATGKRTGIPWISGEIPGIPPHLPGKSGNLCDFPGTNPTHYKAENGCCSCQRQMTGNLAL